MMTRAELLTPWVCKTLQRAAVEAYPREAIGILTTSYEYVPLKNASARPEEQALVSKNELAKYIIEGTLLAVFHSHPNGPNCPSEADMRSQLDMDVPYIIVSTDGSACLEPFAWGDMLAPLPLELRGFQHAVSDCYELIRDHQTLTFPERPRLMSVPRSWNWWLTGKTLYKDLFKIAGYRPLTEEETPEIGDCFLACIRSPRTYNHAGVLVEPGVFLHHAATMTPFDPTRLPKREPVYRYRDYIKLWVRRAS